MRALFVCGGTGGHIYPAIAIAEALIKKYKAEVFFSGSDYGMEKQIIEGKKFSFFSVTARPLIRKFTFKNVINAFYIIKSLFDSGRLIKKLQPDIVIGTGGFVSFPVVFAAAVSGVKTLIHEPNTYPGVANRILGMFASKITAGFAETAAVFPALRTVVTGNPVRDDVIKSDRKKAIKAFGLKADLKTLLIMPGSRAAARINAVMLEALPELAEKCKKLQVIWMTGSADLKRVKMETKGEKTSVKAFDFIKDSGLAYAAADAAVLRAGAGTLSEVAAAGAAAILVPYPHATGNHQEKNAEMFKKRQAAFVILENALTKESLSDAVLKLMDAGTNKRTRQNAKKIYRANSAELIAELAAKEAGI